MRRWYTSFLLIMLLAASASASSFTFSPTSAAFTGSGDVNLGVTAVNFATLDFQVPSYATLSGFSLDTVGDAVEILLGTLTLQEGNPPTTSNNIVVGEDENLGLSIGFTINSPSLMNFLLSTSTSNWVLNYNTNVNDVSVRDVAITWTGVSQQLNFGTTGILQAQIIDYGDRDLMTEYYAGIDPQQIGVRLTLIQADSTGLPEPSTFVLFGTAALALAWLRRR